MFSPFPSPSCELGYKAARYRFRIGFPKLSNAQFCKLSNTSDYVSFFPAYFVTHAHGGGRHLGGSACQNTRLTFFPLLFLFSSFPGLSPSEETEKECAPVKKAYREGVRRARGLSVKSLSRVLCTREGLNTGVSKASYSVTACLLLSGQLA